MFASRRSFCAAVVRSKKSSKSKQPSLQTDHPLTPDTVSSLNQSQAEVLPPKSTESAHSAQIRVLMSELNEHRYRSEELSSQLEKKYSEINFAKGEVLKARESALKLQEAHKSEMESLRASIAREKEDLEEELRNWQNSSESYLSRANEAEDKLRDAQIAHRQVELKWQRELMESRQTAMLPLLLVMGGAALLTWIACHANQLLGHRESALAAAEKEREWLDQKDNFEKQYAIAVTEIKRLEGLLKKSRKYSWW